MKDVKSGEWIYFATETTDKSGRINYHIPDDKTLGYGLYPVKMIVRLVAVLFKHPTLQTFYISPSTKPTNCV